MAGPRQVVARVDGGDGEILQSSSLLPSNAPREEVTYALDHLFHALNRALREREAGIR
jgi:hypothetical protein